MILPSHHVMRTLSHEFARWPLMPGLWRAQSSLLPLAYRHKSRNHTSYVIFIPSTRTTSGIVESDTRHFTVKLHSGFPLALKICAPHQGLQSLTQAVLLQPHLQPSSLPSASLSEQLCRSSSRETPTQMVSCTQSPPPSYYHTTRLPSWHWSQFTDTTYMPTFCPFDPPAGPQEGKDLVCLLSPVTLGTYSVQHSPCSMHDL